MRGTARNLQPDLALVGLVLNLDLDQCENTSLNIESHSLPE